MAAARAAVTSARAAARARGAGGRPRAPRPEGWRPGCALVPERRAARRSAPRPRGRARPRRAPRGARTQKNASAAARGLMSCWGRVGSPRPRSPPRPAQLAHEAGDLLDLARALLEAGGQQVLLEEHVERLETLGDLADRMSSVARSSSMIASARRSFSPASRHGCRASRGRLGEEPVGAVVEHHDELLGRGRQDGALAVGVGGGAYADIGPRAGVGGGASPVIGRTGRELSG